MQTHAVTELNTIKYRQKWSHSRTQLHQHKHTFLLERVYRQAYLQSQTVAYIRHHIRLCTYAAAQCNKQSKRIANKYAAIHSLAITNNTQAQIFTKSQTVAIGHSQQS